MLCDCRSTRGVRAEFVGCVIWPVSMFLHVDVSLRVCGMLCELVVAELSLMSVGVEHGLKSLRVVIRGTRTSLVELHISLGDRLGPSLVIGLIHAGLHTLEVFSRDVSWSLNLGCVEEVDS